MHTTSVAGAFNGVTFKKEKHYFFSKVFTSFVVAALLFSFNLAAQIKNEQGFLYPSEHFNKTRFVEVVAGESVLTAVATIGLQYLWYKKYPKSHFHFFNDNNEWLQMDKVGHATSVYNISAFQYNLMRWSGVNAGTAKWVGGLSGLAYLTVIEIMDGFSKEWGFSKGDMIANISGAALFTGQQALWNQQKMELRFSFHKTIFAKYNPNMLGANLPERAIKDYNGQSYWLSFNIYSFLNKNNNFPKWINADIGYGADGMTGAVHNPTTVNGKPIPSFERNRKFFLGVDGAFTKHGNTPFPSWINLFRIPTPVLELKKNKVTFRPFYF